MELERLRSFVQEVKNLHTKSLLELDKLSDRLGLSTVKVPGNIPADEQEYLKIVIRIQVQKQILWLALQNYQDERGPLNEVSGHGGRSGTLGTSKLTSVTSALKTKSAQVTHALTKFNKLIAELEIKTCPSWIPNGIIPPKIVPQQLLRLEQNDPLWDEVFGGTPWIQDFQSPTQS